MSERLGTAAPHYSPSRKVPLDPIITSVVLVGATVGASWLAQEGQPDVTKPDISISCLDDPTAAASFNFPAGIFRETVAISVDGQESVVTVERNRTSLRANDLLLSAESIGRVILDLSGGAEVVAGRPVSAPGLDFIPGDQAITVLCEGAVT
jgi:hypothetical protein